MKLSVGRDVFLGYRPHSPTQGDKIFVTILVSTGELYLSCARLLAGWVTIL